MFENLEYVNGLWRFGGRKASTMLLSRLGVCRGRLIGNMSSRRRTLERYKRVRVYLAEQPLPRFLYCGEHGGLYVAEPRDVDVDHLCFWVRARGFLTLNCEPQGQSSTVIIASLTG